MDPAERSAPHHSPLDRIAHGNGGYCAGILAERIDNVVDNGVVQKRPGRIVHEHDFRVQWSQTLQAKPNRLLTADTAMCRLEQSQSSACFVEERSVIRMNDSANAVNARVIRQRL